ncbi:hypothetical protein [Actinoplanes sp. URMC 104]|uniref:hypothetical protein n=1 Tax=Actinoplanes sp. URMC 104 TaxID=3423409 RepID=UPI003F199EEE
MTMPEQHAAVLHRVRNAISADDRFLGLAAGGSLRAGTLDAYSDLDFIVVVKDDEHAAVMAGMHEVAASCGTLLAAFTGEHVGEPRLLICLFDDPLLHVDLKFLRLDELGRRTEDPVVLWERGSAVSDMLRRTSATPPSPDAQGIEDRFWVWVHYAATKLGRGELFEALGFLGFLRENVLGPLHSASRGQEPRGVRRLEDLAPGFAAELRDTVAGHDARQCADAVWRCVELYRELRPAGIVHRTAAERASTSYLAEVTGAGSRVG